MLVTQPIQMRQMKLHRRLPEPLCLLLRLGDEDMAQHADRRAAGKLRLGLGRPAPLCERLPEGINIRLGERRRAQAHEMHPVFPRPGGAGCVGRAIPEGGMRLLQRAQGNGHIFVLVVLAGEIERLGSQARVDAVESIDEDSA